MQEVIQVVAFHSRFSSPTAWRSHCGVGAVLAVVLTCCVLTAGVRAGDGPPFPRIANVYGTQLTSDGARVSGEEYSLEDVARCDLLIGVRAGGQGKAKQDLFRKQLAALKAVNPHLKSLHFACSAPYSHIKPTDEMLAKWEAGKPFPWLLQTDQQVIAGWPGTYMLNLTCPGVIEMLAQTTVPPVRDFGYDGVFIDCMGPHFDAWACEIATGRSYTVDHDSDGQDDDRKTLADLWTRGKAALAMRSRDLIGDESIFMANQAHLALKGQLNGIYLEDYIDAVLEGRSDWEQVVELYREWTTDTHQPNVTVLGCSSGVEPPFEGHKLSVEKRTEYFAQGKAKLARMRFGLATTLMGDGYYSYDLHTRWRGQLWWYPEYDAPLGYPIEEARRMEDGTWRRRFDGGVVVVNPTDWDLPINLDGVANGGALRDVSSSRAGTQFVVPRHDGRIYVPASVEVQTGSLPKLAPTLSWDGPAGVTERDGVVVLRDGAGFAALLNAGGRVQSISFRGQELVAGLRTVIVQDSRWKDFDTETVEHRVADDGALVFTGLRTFDQQQVAFTETLRVQGGKLTVDYQWRAATELQIRAFRQAVMLSPQRYGNATLQWDEGDVVLPENVPEQSGLAHGITRATIALAEGRALTVRLPRPSQLLDDRLYNGSKYLLTFYPIAGKVAQERTWSYSIEVEVK